MYTTADLRNGLKVEIEGEPYIVVDFQHVKPGKGGAFVRTRLKSLVTGLVLDRTFRSGEKLEAADVEERTMQFLYRDGEDYVLMDQVSFEQITVPAERMGRAAQWITENAILSVLMHKGNPINVEPPTFVELEIVETDPGVRGDTASGGTKPAKLSTGAVVQVPLFVGVGERIRVDTRDGTYIERA